MLYRFEDLNFGSTSVGFFLICVSLFVIWSCNNHCESGPIRFYEDEHECECEIAVMLLVVLVVVLVIVLSFSSN
jgi:hypothetical protein